MIYIYKHYKHGDFGDGFLLLYHFLDGNKHHWNDLILMGCLGQGGKWWIFQLVKALLAMISLRILHELWLNMWLCGKILANWKIATYHVSIVHYPWSFWARDVE